VYARYCWHVFLLGLIAGILRSDLSIPKAAYDTLSLLLMLIIGLKDGMALYSNMSFSLLGELLIVALIGALIPLLIISALMVGEQLLSAVICLFNSEL
jgi:hypothetical protein